LRYRRINDGEKPDKEYGLIRALENERNDVYAKFAILAGLDELKKLKKFKRRRGTLDKSSSSPKNKSMTSCKAGGLKFVNRSKRLVLEPPKGGCC
jgi:hypothetical protein